MDFSDIEEGERTRNYFNRGGVLPLLEEAKERDTQADRENGALMALYSSASDIPASPREPLGPLSDSSAPEKSFGEPEAITKVNRAARTFDLNTDWLLRLGWKS